MASFKAFLAFKNKNSRFIPRLFWEKFTCNFIEYKNKSQFISFSLDNILPNSFMVKNIHGNHVVYANQDIQEADAHIIVGTHDEIKKLSNKYLAIKTADCLPIAFVYRDKKYFIGGITHAGWRGLSTQIISNTINKLNYEAHLLNIDENFFLQNLKVFICPSIFGVTYECGADVEEALEKHKNILNKNAKQKFEFTLFDICSNVKRDPKLASDINYFAEKYSRSLSAKSIFPDIQLLSFIECISLSILSKNIFIFRENTYGHDVLPSFRESKHKPKEGAKMLWTHLSLILKGI